MRHILKVYYNEMRPDEGIMAYWGELGHALLRFQFSVSEFEKGMSNLQDLQSIYRVHCQLQNYHACAYEFAERLFSFLAALMVEDRKTTKRMLKDANQQGKILSTLSKKTKAPIAPLKRILKVLHDDTEVRHINTHKTFIRLAFNEGYRWVDIEDLWWDLEDDAVFTGKLFKAMSKQGMRLVKEYKSRMEYIDKNLNTFLNALMPYLSKLSV